jgi:hypothetical protein
MWDQIRTTEHLQSWLSGQTFNNDFVDRWIQPQGIGMSLGSLCKRVTLTCLPPDCADLKDVQNEPGAGWNWFVTLSIANLNHVSKYSYCRPTPITPSAPTIYI